MSLANLGGDFRKFSAVKPLRVQVKEELMAWNSWYQQKLSKNFYGILAYTLFWSEYSDNTNVNYRPALWDNRHLLTFTGGYKLKNNWELGLRTRYLGGAPFIPVDVVATEVSYPTIINDFSRIGDERLNAYNSTDIRIDKKWNYRNWSLNIYLEITNVLGSNLPGAPQYGLIWMETGK